MSAGRHRLKFSAVCLVVRLSLLCVLSLVVVDDDDDDDDDEDAVVASGVY